MAEHFGFRAVWCPEVPAFGHDIWVTLARIAEKTSRIKFGPSVLIPSYRHPMAQASAIATLEQIAPGRLMVGFGTGFTGRAGMGKKPLSLASMRTHIAQVKALLRGDTADIDGGLAQILASDGWLPDRPINVPIYMAGQGPKARALAKEIADGLISLDVIDRGPLGFIGGAYVNTSARGAAPIKGKVVPPGTPRWGREWKKAVAYNYRRNMAITSHGTCLSYRHNYLDLDPTYKDAYGLPLLRMTFEGNDNELRMMKYIDERCAEIGRAMNGSHLGGKTKGTHFGLVGYQSTHNVGGAVMGGDPSTSVVNKYLQSWDVSNLFVVGGSAFLQNPANGPTETIGMWPVGRPMRSRRTMCGGQELWFEQGGEPSRYARRTPQNSGNAAFTMSAISARNAVGWNSCPSGMHGRVSSARI